jgi:hypothetical protein
MLLDLSLAAMFDIPTSVEQKYIPEEFCPLLLHHWFPHEFTTDNVTIKLFLLDIPHCTFRK